MKIQVLILFLPLAVLLAEPNRITLPGKATCKKETACNGKKTTSKCSHKKDAGKKESGSCDDKTTCTSCPACCVFILQSQYELATQHFVVKQLYPTANTAITSSYSSFAWKPPDSIL